MFVSASFQAETYCFPLGLGVSVTASALREHLLYTYIDIVSRFILIVESMHLNAIQLNERQNFPHFTRDLDILESDLQKISIINYYLYEI